MPDAWSMHAHAIFKPESSCVTRANKVLSVWSDKGVGEEIERATCVWTPILEDMHAIFRVDGKEVKPARFPRLDVDCQWLDLLCVEQRRRFCQYLPPPCVTKSSCMENRDSRGQPTQGARHEIFLQAILTRHLRVVSVT